MGDIVNLRRVRKDKARRANEATADANRVAHGRTRHEREISAKEKARESRHIEGHRLGADEPASRDD